MPIILMTLTRISHGNTETCLLAAQKSAKSWRATFRPECIKAGETGAGGDGQLDVDLNLPLIPESQYPILFAALPPFFPCARIAVGAAQLLRIFLALLSLRPFLRSPDPLCPPIPNSQCFSLHSPLLSQEDYVPTHLYSPRDSGPGDASAAGN